MCPCPFYELVHYGKKTFDIKLKEYSKKQTIVNCSFDIYTYIESLSPSLTNWNFQTTSTKGYIHINKNIMKTYLYKDGFMGTELGGETNYTPSKMFI